MSPQLRRAAVVVSLPSFAFLLGGCGGGGGFPEWPDNAVTTTITSTLLSTTTSTSTLYACQSTHSVTELAGMSTKGMAIDDTTWWACSDEMFGLWPHTSSKISSIRLFAAWKPQWGDSGREQAWQNLKAFVQANDVKVLMGAEVTCKPDEDEQMWQWGLQLMKLLGKERIMGIAIGNEIDNDNVRLDICRPGFWVDKFWTLYQSRIDDIDQLGMTDTPVTVVWSLTALSGKPFRKNPQNVHKFVKSAYKRYGDRWVWTFNPYAIWDNSQRPQTSSQCAQMTKSVLDISYTINVMKAVRQRITMVTGNKNDSLWIGETGWSSPAPNSLGHYQDLCPDFYSKEVLVRFYEMMLKWDGSLGDGDRVDHTFYFTERDSNNHGDIEGFGLVGGCRDPNCKYKPALPTPAPAPHPGQHSCATLECGGHDSVCWCTPQCKQHGNCCDDYDGVCGDVDPTPAPTRPRTMSMCADLGCGSHDATCWCTDTCKSHNSCCPDYQTKCAPLLRKFGHNMTEVLV